MLKIITFICFLFLSLNAATGGASAFKTSSNPNLIEEKWKEGRTFINFLALHGIPQKVYDKLDREDKELTTEIQAGQDYWLLKGNDGKLAQALIPITDDLQIHIMRDKHGKYSIDFTPIEYEENEKVLTTSIGEGVSTASDAIYKASGNKALANNFKFVFGNRVDFNKIQKGDKLVVIYKERIRMGKPYGNPVILGAQMQVGKKFVSAYRFDEKFYGESLAVVQTQLLTIPVKNPKITSHFQKARLHPILRKYRAHLGTDFGAPIGTKVHASASGVVSFVGTKGGYGRTVIIKHANGISTLYAHLHGFKQGLREGMKVKQNDVIAFVGSSGMSTGPHLHFGVYVGKEAVNPMAKLAIKVVSKEEKKKEELFKGVRGNINKRFELAKAETHQNEPRLYPFEYFEAIK